ncbi:MAG: ion transporter [Cyclobacteriaceae bacterium]|nr:ion transporter [Cyclobacteriaceae bacterium HetDA_MAG_MS6]
MTVWSKRRIFETLEKGEGDDRLSKRFDLFIMTLILLNVMAVILETVESIYVQAPLLFYYFEIFSIIIFSIEYVGRLWTCTYFERYSHPFWGRLKFVFSIAGLIDLMAILPFYLPLLFAMDGRFLRMMRLFRVLRIFKMGRYSTAFNLIMRVIKQRKEELLITLTIVLVLLILASSMMYYLEHEVQPENFSSIPETMWWGVATLTTVGYGDVYPITGFGKVLGAFIAILGVGIFALPAGIIAAGFESEISKRIKRKGRK